MTHHPISRRFSAGQEARPNDWRLGRFSDGLATAPGAVGSFAHGLSAGPPPSHQGCFADGQRGLGR